MAKAKLDWKSLDTGAFKGPVRKAWDAYVKAREPINEKIAALQATLDPQRQELEGLVTAALVKKGHVGSGQEAQFAYRFGGMGFAVTDAKATSKAKVSLD